MNDEVALVTGASRGIGRAIALLLARQGARVGVHYHAQREAAEAVVEEIRSSGGKAIALQADLARPALPPDFVDRLEADLGRAHYLVHAAGIAHEDAAAFMDLSDWDEVLNVNLRGALLVTQAVVPGMLRDRRGAIVLVSSTAGRYGSPGLAAYAASKGGLDAFGRSLAQELGPRGIRVNVVAPGPISTDMSAHLDEPQLRALLERIPLGRLGSAEEVAEVVAFALSEKARYLHGAVLPVDGGMRTL